MNQLNFGFKLWINYYFFFFHQSYFPNLRVSTCFMFVFTNYDIIEMTIWYAGAGGRRADRWPFLLKLWGQFNKQPKVTRLMKDIINLKFITFSPAIYIVIVSERNTLVFIIIFMNLMNLHFTMSVVSWHWQL